MKELGWKPSFQHAFEVCAPACAVLTVLQNAKAMVHAYPYYPDCLALGNELALEAQQAEAGAGPGAPAFVPADGYGGGGAPRAAVPVPLPAGLAAGPGAGPLRPGLLM